MQIIGYGRMCIGNVATGALSGTGAALTAGTEVTLFTIIDPRFLDKAQLGLYIDQVLGAASKVAYGIYFSPDGGVTYYKMAVLDLTTNKGDLVDVPPYVDTNSPAQSTHLRTFVPVPIPPATAMKVTATATGGTAGAYVVTPTFRDN